MSIEEFAEKHNVLIFGPESIFPEFFAVHTIGDTSVLQEDFLICADLHHRPKLTCKIDEYLDTRKFVFFSLGKGYLKTKNSIGLIYDPFILSESTDVNLVENDLLYVLDASGLLQKFARKHLKQIETILDFYGDYLADKAREHPGLKEVNIDAEKIKSNFLLNLESNISMLVCDYKDFSHLQYVLTFENLLDFLAEEQKRELKEIIKKEIVLPNTITKDLSVRIKQYFETESNLLNTFSDEQLEERIIKLRVALKHPIQKGLIGIYVS